jgi:hypothetical protein
MSSVVISGDTSGAITVSAPAVAGTNTLTLQAGTGTNSMNTLATAVASTSGTSIDFTSIPSWVKRITVMFSGVSLSGTDNLLVQIGSGSLSTSGYVSGGFGYGATVNSTAGFIIPSGSAARLTTAQVVITNISGNVWIASCVYGADVATVGGGVSTGNITLGNTLDRVSVTRTGTNTFDAGTINILYEG